MMPKPLEIIERDAIEALVKQSYIVITVGGGGIPVIQSDNGELRVAPPSVIDKDRASSLLAKQLGADLFIISTAIEQVQLNFGEPNQTPLSHLTVEQAITYMDEGHFAEGSMKPKIEAVINFLEDSGGQALITNPGNIARALEGDTGTWLTP